MWRKIVDSLWQKRGQCNTNVRLSVTWNSLSFSVYYVEFRITYSLYVCFSKCAGVNVACGWQRNACNAAHGLDANLFWCYGPGGCKVMSSTVSWQTNSALVYEPKCGRREGVAGSQKMNRAVHRSPNKLWKSNSLFNQCYGPSKTTTFTPSSSSGFLLLLGLSCAYIT
jgi:hypothetical protein